MVKKQKKPKRRKPSTMHNPFIEQMKERQHLAETPIHEMGFTVYPGVVRRYPAMVQALIDRLEELSPMME